jgi:glucose uptake protein
MFVVESLPLAIAFCIVTMLGWGSWANTQELAGKERWPFQLFYWDYALGVCLFSLVFAHTLGSYGTAGQPAVENLHSANWSFVFPALISGGLFNLSNILLVVGIDAAGMSVAFPVGVGLALVIGTVQSYIQAPRGDATLLFAGVALIVAAMVSSAMAHRRLPRSGAQSPLRGLIYSAIAGCLMGFFYPQLMRAISPNFNTVPIVPGMLTPYVALFAFGVGVLASNIVWNTLFMRFRKPDLCRLLSRVGEAARDRGSGRIHLDVGAQFQRARQRCRGPSDQLCARAGRDTGRRAVGCFHLARVSRRACGYRQVPGHHVR